jgi:hypothetical protein
MRLFHLINPALFHFIFISSKRLFHRINPAMNLGRPPLFRLPHVEAPHS